MPSGFGGAAQQAPPEASILTPFPAPRWGEYVEMGNWEELGIVDRERAARMSERDLINCVVSCRDEAQAARAPLEPYWFAWEDLYNLRTFDDDKQEWQSQIVVPEIRTKIRVAKSLIQGGLLDAPEFFKIVNEGMPFDDEAVRFLQRLTDVVQNDAGMLNAYLEAIEQALLLGSGCMGLTIEDFIETRPHIQDPSPQEMFQWQVMAQQAAMYGQQPPPQPPPHVTAMPERRSRFEWRWKDLWSMFPDPRAANFYDGKYIVEESEADEDDIKDRIEAGIYDSDADIGEPMNARGTRFARGPWRKDIADAKRTRRRRHCIHEFTGNIIDREGRLVARNWIITVINERAVVRIGPNPIWKNRSRYIWTTPLPYPGRVWGRSLIDADAHIQNAVTNLLNLALDGAKYEQLAAFVWDSSKTSEPYAPDSIEPGKVYVGNDPSVLTKLQFPSNVNAIWPLINQLYDIGGKSTQIGEWADGTPTSRGRPSAEEVRTKTSAGTAYVHNMMRDLERNDLNRALQLTLEAALQFSTDTSEPRLKDLLEQYGGPQWFQDDRQRWSLLDKSYRIEAGGISMLMSRDTLIERMMQFIQTMGSMGMMIPPETMAELPFIVLTGLGLTPEQIHYPTSPQAYQQLLMQVQMQQAAMMGGGGPGGGPGTAQPGQAPSPMGLPPPGQQQMQPGPAAA